MLSLQSSEMERYGRDFGIAEASLPLNQPDAIRGEAVTYRQAHPALRRQGAYPR
jgi:hypothetical protein